MYFLIYCILKGLFQNFRININVDSIFLKLFLKLLKFSNHQFRHDIPLYNTHLPQLFQQFDSDGK